MNTRPQECLPYRDLARQQARISRRIALEQLPRLAGLVSRTNDLVIDVILWFGQDREGRVIVTGQVIGSLPLTCNGCAEELDHGLELEFGCLIAESDEIASRAADTGDVLVVDGPEVTIAEIIEDEILLGLPERLCESIPCGRAPVLDYPILEGSPISEPDPEADNPFSVLAGLDVTTKKPLE